MKAVYEPQSSGSLPLLNADGPQLLIEKKQILERWAKHFDSVPNRPASVNDKVIAHLPQVEPLNWTTSPLKRSKRGCQAALLRQSSWIRRYPCSSIQGMIQKLTQLFQSIWREEKVPQQFKDFHDGMIVKVLDVGDESSALQVTNGCVLAPTHFSMMFSAMLTDTCQACDDANQVPDERQAFQPHAPAGCRKGACDNFGFTISTKKTEVMYQPAPGKPYQDPLSQSKDRTYKQWINSPIWAVPSYERKHGLDGLDTSSGSLTADCRNMFYSEFCQGKRTVGGQKKSFTDCLKTFLTDLSIDISCWETHALDRTSWRSKLATGARAAEHDTSQRFRESMPYASTTTTHLCPTCGRLFRA
ncbi:hypothetical protein RRG08_000165 [Elysia crispata]|uniref:Reverse transcriptase domain-containing protein n=1 Tax=Elysia crispata TaxID=231223 RepID=A0AAE0YV45_9GAST|nr:hypothetical protein RRG08_000165 [Elysia crispata]